ncbi:MAG TPA: YeeE/YedE thiosulfate transporter family protein [Anaeromyxobacter sp.]|nr:YeeE/YedE thiosulfate transporter family protein [Anaeromyxobacter sp.]
MTFPIESLAGDRRSLGLALAVVLGVAFGFVLERAGLGRVRKLVGQFYGYDMTVLRVLFSAIVTAMAGAVILSGLGVLDLAFVQARYPTYLWPMIVGGIVLGAGFVLSGYCPGTCVVAASTGKLDALATVGGLALGGLAYAELEAALGAFPASGAQGAFTLSQWLGLPAPVVGAAVALLALGAFLAAGRIERLVAGRGDPARGAEPASAPAGADVALSR